MRQMRRVLTTLCLALVAGCITDPVTGDSVVGLPTSDAEEQAMGLSYKPKIIEQFAGAYPDAEIQRYLGAIVLKMARKSARRDLKWEFTVVNSNEPNAFAVPGGQVFITRGMLAALDDEAEFAVIMGHEIGHVEHRHTVQAMGRDQLIGTAGQVAGQYVGSEEVGGLAAGLLVARYSRDQERESDVRGVYNAYHAGYDPRQGADVFRKFMQMKGGGGGGGIEAWISSHPLDEERIESVMKLSADIDPRLKGKKPVPGLIIQTDRFAQIVAKMRGGAAPRR